MTIEVEPERLDQAREKALRKLAPRAKVPGFRPGKAPPAMVRRYFGEERILDEALDALVPDVYREAVRADESIDPIARPRLVVETTEPLVVKATIPVRPTIELGDYQAVRVEGPSPSRSTRSASSRRSGSCASARRRSSPSSGNLAGATSRASTCRPRSKARRSSRSRTRRSSSSKSATCCSRASRRRCSATRRARPSSSTCRCPRTIKSEKFAGKQAPLHRHHRGDEGRGPAGAGRGVHEAGRRRLRDGRRAARAHPRRHPQGRGGAASTTATTTRSWANSSTARRSSSRR